MDETTNSIVRTDAEPSAIAVALANMETSFRAMAAMLATTNERMAALEKEVRHLTKITPSQYKALNAEIRKRAGEVCKMHHADGCEQAAAAAIRRAMRATCGISSARELPRTDYDVAIRQVRIWDDYKAMQEIKAKGEQK